MTTTAARIVDDLPELDVFESTFAADPYAGYRVARANGWAARSARGVEILTYDACEAALLDPAFRPAAARMVSFLGEEAAAALMGPGRTLLGSEGADHTVMRRAASPWFTPRRVSDLRQRTRALVEQLVDGLVTSGGGEFVDAVARVVPGVVFCWMVGAPERDGRQLAVWSETLLKAFNMNPDDGPAITAASGELQEYVDALIATKHAEPADDVTSMLLAAEAAGTIDAHDVVSALREMLAASTDNTMHSAAIQLWLLLELPGQWERLLEDRGLVPAAVEECGRYEPRVASTPVVNIDPYEYRGLRLPAESMSWLVFASAHRDPDIFDDPDVFDIMRESKKGQLSFGIGRHFCLGAALARMELQVMLEVMLERGPTVRLAGPPVVDRTFGATVHALPIEAGPRTR